jgi:hypothetical protein
MKLFSIFISIVVFLSAIAGSANAATTPTFPVCANPGGTVKSSYDSGVHGVPGDSNTYTGKDTVYIISENTLVQCLCPLNGNGIQTNWWKVSGLSQEEINVLVNEGWISVPNGSAWGLDNAPYLAKNSSYSCSSSGTGGSSDNKSNGSTNGSSVTKDILSLASTGNSGFIYGTFLAGVALLGSGMFLSFKKRG